MVNILKIAEYICTGCNDEKRIGLELEHFIITNDGGIVGYEAVVECLEQMIIATNAKRYEEAGNLFGFITNDYSVSLEPGCQIEISISPQYDVKKCEEIYNDFRSLCDGIIDKRGYKLVETGVHPLVEGGCISVEKLPLLPRKRYEYMDSYFENTGKKGKYMMRATASTQVSFDFKSMEDAMLKMRVLEKISPILALLVERTSGVRDDKYFKPFLFRNQIWQDVDADRCGYFEGTLDEGYSFADYAKYVYEKPCILLQKDGQAIDLQGKSAKEYYGEKELDIEEHIISMFFPMVRLKKYIEYRVADAMPIKDAIAYTTLLYKLIYEQENLVQLDKMLAHITDVNEIYEAENIIFDAGYSAKIYGKHICEWLWDIINIALKKSDEEEARRIKELINLPMINYEYTDFVYGKENEHVESAAAIKEYILGSTAKYHERAVRTLYLPKLFTEKELIVFRKLIGTLYGIFDKVIKEYENNEEYRRLFGFSKELEQLILKPLKYNCNIPISRIDIFFNDETKEFKFCEFNTDGASAMNEDRELNNAFTLSKAHNSFKERYNSDGVELFDNWVKTALELYGQFCGDKEKVPNVAIVDFLEHGTVNEFEIFRQRFEKIGVPTRVCDIRSLKWDGQCCYTEDGMQVDVIYRRAVTSDIMEHYDEVPDFIDMALSGKICLLGDFKTQIVHNKILFKILHLEETKKLLTAEERLYVEKHVPLTVSLEKTYLDEHPDVFESVLNQKDKWIIKPEDSYGSLGVCAGEEKDEEGWKQVVYQCIDKNYILQEFIEPYRLRNIDLLTQNNNWITTSNLTGLFVYGGKLGGMYSRVSFDKIISTQYNEMSVPTMIVSPK